jgi:hypothetical protein
VFIFGSIRFLSKKITKPNFKKKKPKLNQNRFKPTGFGSVWFGFLEQKPVQTGLVFFSSFFSSVFLVPGLKNQNRTEPVGFFKILIGFFSQFGFFGYFFSSFLGLIGFSVFLNTPITS